MCVTLRGKVREYVERRRPLHSRECFSIRRRERKGDKREGAQKEGRAGRVEVLRQVSMGPNPFFLSLCACSREYGCMFSGVVTVIHQCAGFLVGRQSGDESLHEEKKRGVNRFSTLRDIASPCAGTQLLHWALSAVYLQESRPSRGRKSTVATCF